MAKKYTIGEDFVRRGKVRKDDCNVEFAVQVTQDLEGSLQPAKGTVKLFRNSEKDPFYSEDTDSDGWVRYKHTERLADSEEEISYQATFSSAKDHIPAKPVRKDITIPPRHKDKERSGDKTDFSPRINLFLSEPVAQVQDEKVIFKTALKLNAPHSKLDACYPVELVLDDVPRPEKPLTAKGTGEAFIRFSLDRTAERQDYRFSARVTIDGRIYTPFRAWPIYVLPKPQKEEWEFSHLEIDLRGERSEGDEAEQYNFWLFAEVSKFENLVSDPTRIRKAKLTDDDVFTVRFFKDWSKTPLPEVPETDKHGKADTMVVEPAGDMKKRLAFHAEIDYEKLVDGKKVSKKAVSNPFKEFLPKRESKGKDNKDNTIRPHIHVEDSETPNWMYYLVTITESGEKDAPFMRENVQISSLNGSMLVVRQNGDPRAQRGKDLIFRTNGRASFQVMLAELPQGMAGDHIIFSIAGTRIQSKQFYISGLFVAPREHGDDQTQTVQN